jgi:hypothetical protein
VQNPLQNMDVIGRNGESLRDHLADGSSSYLGTFFSGFPNFAMLVGPNTATGHAPVTFHTFVQRLAMCPADAANSECQVNFVNRVFKDVLQGRADAVAVTEKAENEYYAWVRRKMKKCGAFPNLWTKAYVRAASSSKARGAPTLALAPGTRTTRAGAIRSSPRARHATGG